MVADLSQVDSNFNRTASILRKLCPEKYSRQYKDLAVEVRDRTNVFEFKKWIRQI